MPEPTEPDHPYLVSYVFQPGVVWRITRQPDSLHQHPRWYRVLPPGWMLEQQAIGWSRSAYRLESHDVLILGNRRYRRAADADAREWPPELELGSP